MADFQQHLEDFTARDTRLVALSADRLDDARATVERLGLAFPVLYDLDADGASHTTGCYTSVRQGRPHVQPATFVLDADGSIVHAVYSSGKVGRLTARDALTVLNDLRARHPARPEA